MVPEITTSELRDRLSASADLTVLDIREAHAFADWHIAGAVNLPVIGSIHRGDLRPVEAGADMVERGKPVVVVCNRGISSVKAATVLQALGFEAISLAGGMRAWSLVHTVARAPLGETGDAELVQVRRNGKGCLTYVIRSGDAIAVIDPAVDAEVYLDLATGLGGMIRFVLETHVHADHISRARSLAAAAGVPLRLPANERVHFDHSPVHDGETIDLGDLQITAMSTPGHTGESTCYRMADALLSGDTLFVDSVGRPDLEKGDAGAEAGARALYATLHQRLLVLPDDTWVYPAHAGGNIGFDGQIIRARLGDLRGLELLSLDEDAFVATIVGRLGAKPPSFEAIIGLNEGRLELGDVDPLDVEAGPNRCAVR